MRIIKSYAILLVLINIVSSSHAGSWQEFAKNFNLTNECSDEDRNKLIKEAELGNKYAQLNLGKKYITGICTYEKNEELAIKLITKSADQGLSHAQDRLAYIYKYGEIVKKDASKAFKWSLKAAKQGITTSQFNTAKSYHYGTGTEKNVDEAVKWYSEIIKSTPINSHHGIYIWSYVLIGGIKYEQNECTNAIKFLTDAINKAEVFNSKQKKYKSLWYPSTMIDSAITEASLVLGFCYDFGPESIKNNNKAFKWYLKAAKQGNISAQLNIGIMYSYGIGTLTDKDKAFKWYLKAAEQGNAIAQLNIGVMYIDGDGIDKNLSKAKYWTNKAYENPKADSSIKEKAKNNWNNNELWKYENTDNNVESSKTNKSTYDKSGTGFNIDKSGFILTNNHVVSDCSTIKAGNKQVKVISHDASNDLALLKGDKSSSAAYFRSGRGVRLGESVTITGYPLRSILGSGLNAVTGTVSSLTGVKNNTSQFQITAPVNSGNSGGPVLDKSGNIVGVVVSKIRKKDVQGVGFAIKGSTARDFLDINNIDYEVAKSKSKLSNVDIVEKAKGFTVLIKCWKGNQQINH